jgi:hypothetical protein
MRLKTRIENMLVNTRRMENVEKFLEKNNVLFFKKIENRKNHADSFYYLSFRDDNSHLSVFQYQNSSDDKIYINHYCEEDIQYQNSIIELYNFLKIIYKEK